MELLNAEDERRLRQICHAHRRRVLTVFWIRLQIGARSDLADDAVDAQRGLAAKAERIAYRTRHVDEVSLLRDLPNNAADDATARAIVVQQHALPNRRGVRCANM